MAKNFPHPKKDSSKSDASRGPSNNSGGSSDKKTRWYRIKPKDNESHEQTRNDKKYYWCDKCSRWNPTHKTAAHVVQFKKNKEDEKPSGKLCVNFGDSTNKGSLIAGFLSYDSSHDWLKE